MNAKTEFIRHINGKPQVVAAWLWFNAFQSDAEVTLYKNFDSLQFIDFMARIDRDCYNYDGTIWYEDGTWSERVTTYEGEELWEHRVCPDLPRKKLK